MLKLQHLQRKRYVSRSADTAITVKVQDPSSLR